MLPTLHKVWLSWWWWMLGVWCWQCQWRWRIFWSAFKWLAQIVLLLWLSSTVCSIDCRRLVQSVGYWWGIVGRDTFCSSYFGGMTTLWSWYRLRQLTLSRRRLMTLLECSCWTVLTRWLRIWGGRGLKTDTGITSWSMRCVMIMIVTCLRCQLRCHLDVCIDFIRGCSGRRKCRWWRGVWWRGNSLTDRLRGLFQWDSSSDIHSMKYCFWCLRRLLVICQQCKIKQQRSIERSKSTILHSYRRGNWTKCR